MRDSPIGFRTAVPDIDGFTLHLMVQFEKELPKRSIRKGIY
jgi:hypothetical protein